MKKNLLLVLSFLILSIAVAITITACKKDENAKSTPKAVKFAVLSDIHYFDQSLFDDVPNVDFETYLAGDRKLIKESESILEAALVSIEAEKPAFILISGDLTKDGEKANHQKLAARFKLLADKGIKVLVIPGNHDIENPDAMEYKSGVSYNLASVSDEEFATIYKDCGYGDAVERDPNSLSYVSEPVQGIWVLGIDACLYKDNQSVGYPLTGGSISEATKAWMLNVISKAKQQKKQLVTMMHHGMLEHFTGQSQFFPDYVITDWQSVSREMADAGLKFVFTGHFHANDITKGSGTGSSFIFDIETGSSVTYPCPYRMVNLNTKDSILSISTKKIEDVTYQTIPAGTSFQSYAKTYVFEGLKLISKYMLIDAPYSVPESVVTDYKLDSIMSNAFVAHYAGDETPSTSDNADLTTVNAVSTTLGQAFGSVWKDLNPKDNTITIDLKTGLAN